MDVTAFAENHVPQITAVFGLITYALARQKLTPGGVFAAILVAVIHMIHPWKIFFWLPILFFFLGTLVTKVRDYLSFLRRLSRIISSVQLQHSSSPRF